MNFPIRDDNMGDISVNEEYDDNLSNGTGTT